MKKIKEKKGLFIKSRSEKIVFGVMLGVFCLYALSFIYPLLWMLISSFKPKLQYNNDMASGNVFALPQKWVFENYSYAFSKLQYKKVDLFGLLFNSVWYCVVSVGISTFFPICTGYLFAKYDFKCKEVLYAAIIVCMTLPIFGTGGAQFEFYYKIGLWDTPLYVVVTSISGFGMSFLMLYAFFKNLSWEYAEAVFIDGGNDFIAFFRIMIPMAKPIIMTLGVMGLIGAWNSYEGLLIYLPSYPTLAVGIYGLSSTLTRVGNTPAYFAALMISVLPIMAMFVAFSDVIMENFSVGGLKG